MKIIRLKHILGKMIEHGHQQMKAQSVKAIAGMPSGVRDFRDTGQ